MDKMSQKTCFHIKVVIVPPKSYTGCLKIKEKVSLNIASEASYVCILSRQKLLLKAKNDPFWQVFENLKLAVNPDRSILKGQNLVENAQIEKFKCDIFGDFQTIWNRSMQRM